MSLFSICLEFITSNISNVDSLMGFPMLVGRQLFERCDEKETFSDVRTDTKGKTSLKVFFDAYGDSGILDALEVKNCHLFVNDILFDCSWLLSHLKQLDLSFCKLGDDHELLPLVMKLERLETLKLCDNCLSDKGIQMGTLPLRFQYDIKSCLKNLDLSSNNVTHRCLGYLKSLQNLCIVKIADSSFCIKGSNITLPQRFTVCEACPCIYSKFCVTSSGWASKVIEGWKTDYFVSPKSQGSDSIPSSSVSATIPHRVKSFYSKSYSVHQTTKRTALASKSSNIILTTDLFHCDHVPSKRLLPEQGNLQGQTFYQHSPEGDIPKLPKELKAATQLVNRKRRRSEHANDVCLDRLGEFRMSKRKVVKEKGMSKEGVEISPDNLLDMYRDKANKRGHGRGSLLRELNDWG